MKYKFSPVFRQKIHPDFGKICLSKYSCKDLFLVHKLQNQMVFWRLVFLVFLVSFHLSIVCVFIDLIQSICFANIEELYILNSLRIILYFCIPNKSYFNLSWFDPSSSFSFFCKFPFNVNNIFFNLHFSIRFIITVQIFSIVKNIFSKTNWWIFNNNIFFFQWIHFIILTDINHLHIKAINRDARFLIMFISCHFNDRSSCFTTLSIQSCRPDGLWTITLVLPTVADALSIQILFSVCCCLIEFGYFHSSVASLEWNTFQFHVIPGFFQAVKMEMLLMMMNFKISLVKQILLV